MSTTVEDLFVEIFERKHKIIELVKQHTDRYSQHLATKCKIQGINPPLWLCSSQQSSNLKVLNKEQLISEYFPRPPTARYASARCSLNKRPVVRDDDEDMSHGTFLEVHVSNKGLHPEVGAANTAVDPDNNQECALNTVPESDVSVNSPLDQTDVRVLNNFNDLDLSLARIQRSKSRQKALQLRNSAQAEATGCPSRQKKVDVAPIGIGLSTSEQVHHNESQKWAEPSVVSNSSGGFRESAKRNHEEEREISLHTGASSKHKASTQCLECVNHSLKGDNLSDVAERSHTTKVDNSFATAQESHSTHKHSCNFASKSTSLSASQLIDVSDKPDHLGESFPVGTEVSKLKEFVEVHQHEGIEVNRVTRSRSNCKQLNCINDSLKVNGSANVDQKDDHTQARSAGCVSDRPLQGANISNIHKPTVKSYQETKKKNGTYCGRITRSRSMAQKFPCLGDDSHVTISTFSDRVNTGLFAPAIGGSLEVLCNNLDSSKSVRPSLVLDHKSPKTQSSMDNEVITEPVDTSTVVGSECGGSMIADSEKSSHEDYDIHCPTGSKSISPSSDNNDAHNQQGNTEAVMEGSPTCRSRTSNSKPKERVEHVVANSPHDCFMPMKPKQLDFDDREECNLKRTFTPNFEEKSLKSIDKVSNISLEPTSEKKISGSPVDNRLSREQSILEQEISSKSDGVPGSSFTTKIREPAGTEMNGRALDMNEQHTSRNTKYGSRGRQSSRQSSYLHDDETLSNDVGRHDADASHVEINLKESYNSLAELHIEVGSNRCDRTAQCLPASDVANTKIAATPRISSLSKKVTRDSQDCLPKNFEIEDLISILPDVKRRSCTPNDPNFSSFNGENSHVDVCVKCDMDRDSHHKESGMLTWSPLQSRQNDEENLNVSISSEIENTREPSFDGRFRSVKLDSWPQVKRKTIEDNPTNCFSACPNSQMSKLYQIKMDAVNLNFSTSQEKTDNVVEHRPSRTKSSSVGIFEKKNCHLKEGTASLPNMPNEVVGKSCDRNPQCLPASYVVNTKTAATRHISTLTEKVTGDSQDCLVKELELEDPTSTSPDAKRQPSMPNNPNLSCLDGENSHGYVCGKHNMDRHSHQKEDDMPTWSPQQSGCNDEENLDLSISSEIENARESSLFDGRFRSVKLDSWPQVKRKRIEDKQTNCFSLCPSSQMSKLQMDALSFDSNTIKEKSDNVVEHTPFRANSSNLGISEKKICPLKEGIGSLLKLQNKVDAICFEKQNNSTDSASSSDDELLRVSHVSSLFKEPADKELETGEEHELLSNAEKFSDEQDIPDLLHLEKNVELDPENLTCLERKSHIGEQSLYSQSFVCSSPQNRVLDIIDADQSEPVLEGFIIDAPTADGELDIAQLEINYETTIQRASILEQICKSATAHTPLSHLTSSFGFDRTQYLYQSLPNGLLEHLDLSTFLSEDDVNKQLRASYSCVDEVKDSKLEIHCSDYQPSYGCQFGGWSGNQYQSPVGKFWERIPSHSSSSEKGLNLNPELMCFPIEEDPNSSEENETADVAGKIRDEFDSTVVNSHVNGLPLADITNSCLNPPASVSAAERSHARGSLDYANTDVSCTGHRNKAKRKLGSSLRNMSAVKVKQTFSMGAKGIKQGKESLRRSSRPKLSAKSSFKRERQPSHNNIVSNMTSFIPLVQQKQAAAVCTGKRDVKVKALEAAEAAKRLEEKRENKRKMRKEEMKHERARLEQENSKQLEFHKKKKEEEKNKKEADAIARKRLREEEEKNERERKRKRLEEAQRQQREQDNKTHAKRAEKDKGLPTNDEKKTAKKKCNSDVEKCQKEGVGKTFKKKESEPKPTETLRNDSFQATPSPGRCRISDTSTDNEKTCVLGKPDASTERGAKKSREKSYEISPYQCSDDEEDEDEDPPIRKFIPSWASKPNVASVLPLQQGIDPDSIFPPKSFCSMDEVLVPRKVQQRPVAI